MHKLKLCVMSTEVSFNKMVCTLLALMMSMQGARGTKPGGSEILESITHAQEESPG